jgi:hypothetical protein
MKNGVYVAKELRPVVRQVRISLCCHVQSVFTWCQRADIGQCCPLREFQGSRHVPWRIYFPGSDSVKPADCTVMVQWVHQWTKALLRSLIQNIWYEQCSFRVCNMSVQNRRILSSRTADGGRELKQGKDAFIQLRSRC